MEHLQGEIKGSRNFNLYYQGWLPTSEPKAILLIVHGLADHSGRYNNLVTHFIPQGYAVYGFDQRGHGKSPGKRGYIEDFSYFIDDLGLFLRFIRNKHEKCKIFIIGHSIGGTIATAYAISHQDGFDGLILSAATLKLGASVPPILVTTNTKSGTLYN
jgi:acylglycerol lipase